MFYQNLGLSLLTTPTSISLGLKSTDKTVDKQEMANCNRMWFQLTSDQHLYTLAIKSKYVIESYYLDALYLLHFFNNSNHDDNTRNKNMRCVLKVSTDLKLAKHWLVISLCAPFNFIYWVALTEPPN